MARKLVFDPWSKENQESNHSFMNLYGAFIGRQDNPNRARSLEETRTALKILDAFDTVSDIHEEGDMKYRTLKEAGGAMELTEEAFKLLQTAVDAYVGTLPFALARPGMKMKEYLDTLPLL